MSNNAQNTPENFLIQLIDEEDVGSELESLDSGDEEVIDLGLSVYNDRYIDDMPILSQTPNGTMYLLSYHAVSTELPSSSRASAEERERSPLPRPQSPEERDRSPLRVLPSRSSSITPPPYSPLSCPENESLVVDFGAGQSEEPANASGEIARGRGGSRRPSRGRESRGYRGGQRNKAGATVSSRGHRAATMVVNGESRWQRGDRVLEVCLDDDDVPPRLKDMMYDLESSRRARDEQQLRREKRRKIRKDDVSEDEDEFFDAESFIAQELFGGDSGATQFQWSPMATFSGHAEEFLPEKHGPNVKVTSAYEAFRMFWDDEILEHIVQETNRYAEGLKLVSDSFASSWVPTNVHEILMLFAFWMMIGIIRMPSIKSCFSNHPLLKTTVFSTIITETRYWNLNRALHFVDNSTRTPDSSKLFCLGPIVEHLNRKFQEAYTPGRNIAIDESLTLWKGNLSFKQFIKTKAARFGIKTFELCESSTGYLWSFFIYAGKDGESPSLMRKSTEVVIRLIKPLLNRGHRLFMDNWFNSPLLARYLKRNKTDCVGTLRKSCKHVPAIIQLASLEEGTCVARHSGDVVVMAYQDKNTVYTISTCHGTESVHFKAKPGKPAHFKPAIIADYNSYMGGIDKKDQMLEPYLLERKKNRKWYKKMFKRLLNVSIFNSRILVDQSTETAVKTQSFRLDLVSAILKEHSAHAPTQRRRADHAPPASSQRLLGCNHFIARIPPPLGSRNTGNQSGRRLCQWCLKRHGFNRKTTFLCETCNVPLCLDECFRLYHTEP